jgi:hypothetical protein
MSEAPLRAVILDNDETTGSYMIIYSIITGITTVSAPISLENYHLILQRLAHWMVTHNVFRPGIRALLRTIFTLKKAKALDAVVMYTNQTGEIIIQLEENIYRTSVPNIISYMLEFLNDSSILFDCILTRDESVKRLPNGWYPKNFSRILDFYPNRPRDIRQMVFVDDMSLPEYIHAHDIPDTHKTEESWYFIPPYYRYLSQKEVYECVFHCLEGIVDFEKNPDIFKKIFTYYQDHYHKHPSSTPNAKHFLELSEHLIRKFHVLV